MKLRTLLVFAAIAFTSTTKVKGSLDLYIRTTNPTLVGEVAVAPSGGVCPVNCGPGTWQIFSVSWGVSNPGSFQPGVGWTPGQPAFSDLNLQKMLDKASVEALLKLAQGGNIGTVTLSFVENTSPPFLSYEIVLENVYFTSIQHSGAAGGDNRPTESVSFAYGKITWIYHPRPVGTPAITHFWNLLTNTGG